MSPLQTDTNQNETDNIIKYCESGNCPCGDGFCSKGGYCIQDKCFCGANPDKGTFDIQVVASNNYGEFECTAQIDHHTECDPSELYDLEECPPWDYYNDLICTREEGCKTGDGREYPKTQTSYDDEQTSSDEYDNYKNRDNLHIASENDKHIDDIYVELIEEYYLTKNYGKKLPDELKYLKRGGAESVRLNEGELVNNLNHKENRLSFRGWLRETCHDHGVTKEHISEYVCDIGRYYSMDCTCASNSKFS